MIFQGWFVDVTEDFSGTKGVVMIRKWEVRRKRRWSQGNLSLVSPFRVFWWKTCRIVDRISVAACAAFEPFWNKSKMPPVVILDGHGILEA
jgi:hypothetical protein